MRFIKSPLLTLLCATLFATPFCIAQTGSPQVAQPTAAPASLQKLDEVEAPAVSITPPASEQTISQKRQQGQVSEVKVQSGQSTYYLKPNQQAGSAVAGDAQGSTMRAPQWQVLEFNLGGNRDNPAEKKEVDTAQQIAPPPPALTVPPAKK